MKSGNWYFTAPWEAVSARRGDPLGFRAGADFFADLLAPGISNGTTDARWISILSWCLKWSHLAYARTDTSGLSRRDQQRVRYAWLRPLELLWIDRALGEDAASASGMRAELRGRRSIERWRSRDRATSDFAMSPEQLTRYRQTGTYGAYRVIFRRIPGLTNGGDGWTLSKTAEQLADLVNNSLPSQARLSATSFNGPVVIRWGHWSNGKQADYWITRGWPSWQVKPHVGKGPTPYDQIDQPIDDPTERALLAGLLFDKTSVRYTTATELAKAKNPKSHLDLCLHLAESSQLKDRVSPELLQLLPVFSRFADAAMDAMRALWNEVSNDGTQQSPELVNVAKSAELAHALEQLNAAASLWLQTQGADRFPHSRVVTELASSIQRAGTVLEGVQALLAHHYAFGGGRRWLQEQGGRPVPLVPDTGITSSDYRFRLHSLSLLAAQCDVVANSHVLDALNHVVTNDEVDE